MPPYGNVSSTTMGSDMEVDYDKNVTKLYESISESNWERAIDDAKMKPNEAKTWVVRHDGDNGEIMWRFLPIHSACARQPPESVVNALLSAYPQGAQCKDDQGMLPLHYACGNQASVEVIRLLLLANADAATTPDPSGMLPLHYVAQWGPSSLSVVHLLLFSDRSIINVKDIDGNTPIDLAREADYPERNDVISALEQFRMAEDSRMIAKGQQQQKKMNNSMVAELTTPTTSNRNSAPMSMPRTSEAVRRLQEAAAVQQQNRSKNDDSRDSNNALRTSVAGNNNFNRGLSVDDMSFNDSGSIATMKLVATLKAEVEKLRTEAETAEAEAEEKLNSEREAMQSALDELKIELTTCQQETMDSLAELTAKEEFGQYVEGRLKEKEEELANALKIRERLQMDLNNLKKNVDEYKSKTAKLDEQLSSLFTSMQSMMKDQELIMKASVRHEEHLKKVALARQQRMQELIDQEVTFAKLALEKQKQGDLGSEELINEALDKQKRLMAAVSSVLAESRC